MSLKKKINRYGVLIVGLLIGGGFAFGGIASYAGLTGGQSSNNNQQFNASLPVNMYSDGSYGLSAREQKVLAVNNDVVFVSGFYETKEQKQELTKLRNLTQTFQGRLYVQVVNGTTSGIAARYGVNEFPKILVMGGARTRQGTVLLDDSSLEAVSTTACNSMLSWGSLSAYCQAR